MDMQTLKAVGDVIGTMFWIWLAWEMVKGMRVLAAPEPDGLNLILSAIRRIQVVVDPLSFRLEGIEDALEAVENSLGSNNADVSEESDKGQETKAKEQGQGLSIP